MVVKEYIGIGLGATLGVALCIAIAESLGLDDISLAFIGIILGGALGEFAYRITLSRESGTLAAQPSSINQSGDEKLSQASKPQAKQVQATSSAPKPQQSPVIRKIQQFMARIQKEQAATLDLKGDEILALAIARAPYLPIDVKKLSGRLMASVREMPQCKARDRLYDLTVNIRDQHPTYVQDERLTSFAMTSILNLMGGDKDGAQALERLHMVFVGDMGAGGSGVHMMTGGNNGENGIDVHQVTSVTPEGIIANGSEQEPFFTIPLQENGDVGELIKKNRNS